MGGIGDLGGYDLMKYYNIASTVLLSAVLSPAGLAQIGGFGGFSGYSGMGSAGNFPQGESSPRASWRPWLRAGGYYQGSPLLLDEDGNTVVGSNTGGASMGWGVAGQQPFKNTAIVASYNGNALLRTGGGNNIDGMSNILNFGVTHRFNRSLYGSVQQMLGSTLGGYGIGTGFGGVYGGFSNFGLSSSLLQNGLLGFGDPAVNGLVDEEIYSNRTNFSGTFGTLAYRLTHRSTVSGSVGVQFARRKARPLADTDSLFSSAGYSYAINRRTQVGANYSVGRFTYPNRFGNSRFQNIGIGMGRQLTRNAVISGTIGVAQIDSLSNGIIVLDPESSAILGVAAVTRVNDARRRFMTGSLSAGYATEWAYLRAIAQRGMVPGNGILYGGVRDLVSVGASRGFNRSKLTTGISASMSRISGVLQSEVQVRYQTVATVSYSISRGIFMNVSGGFRWQRLAMTGPFFNQEFVSASIGWTPEGYPLNF